MSRSTRTGIIAAVTAIAIVMVVAVAGVLVLSGGLSDWNRSGGAPSSNVDAASPWGLPNAPSGGVSGQDGGGDGDQVSGEGSSSTGGGDQSSGDGGSELPTPPSDDDDQGSGSGDSGSSSPPAATDHIFDGPRIDGFYTGRVPVWAGDDPDRGTKVDGSDLQAGVNYAVRADADVTDYGLQWYKDGATLVNDNNYPTAPTKMWMAVDTSVVMFLEIHSDRPISAQDVLVSGVYGKQLALYDASLNGPGMRSMVQVDPYTVRVFLDSQPFTASSSAGGFQGPISLASSNGSIEEFNDKGALAAYSPMKIVFNTPGDYVLSFYLAQTDAGSIIGDRVSPTTAVPVTVSAVA